MTLDPPISASPITETPDFVTVSASVTPITSPPFEPPLIFKFTAPPPVLPSSSSPPSPSQKSPSTISFSSSPQNASVVISLPALRATHSNSYISKKQASLFNAPPITLPPSFYDQSSASWKISSSSLKPLPIPPLPLPISNSFLALSTDPEEAIPDGSPPQPSL